MDTIYKQVFDVSILHEKCLLEHSVEEMIFHCCDMRWKQTFGRLQMDMCLLNIPEREEHLSGPCQQFRVDNAFLVLHGFE